MLERTPGLTLDKGATVENVVAIALYRRYEPVAVQAGGFNDPDRLHVFETRAPREIDFVCGPRRAAELVEVKFQRNVTRAATQTMRKAFPAATGVVASIDAFELDDRFAVVPACLLLWALG